MANLNLKEKFVVREQLFSANAHMDAEAFYSQQHGDKPTVLTSRLVYLLGSQSAKYPISTMLESGIIKGSMKTVKEVQYEYPVVGRLWKASKIASAPTSLTPNDLGIGNSPFYLIFEDNWIKKYYIIESQRGVQLYVTSDPVQLAPNQFRYEVVLTGANPTVSCPVSEVQAGVTWVMLNTAISWERSRGTTTNTVNPGKVKNQMANLRGSATWGDSGNFNRIMNIEIYDPSRGKTNSWISWIMWQFEQSWLAQKENYYWYSRYNRDHDTGQIALKDKETGQPITRGSGLLEQIPNYRTYTRLSAKLLTDVVTNALFGLDDADNMSLTLYTGTGGKREFHRAMIEAFGQNAFVPDKANFVSNHFLGGEGVYNLALGGYFDTFYHIDGYTIKVVHNPMFDKGYKAIGSARHPEGLPLESYRMVFIDEGAVDGQPNIQVLRREGYEFKHNVVLGLTDAPKDINALMGGSVSGSAAPSRSSETNEGSYHRMESIGIQLLRPNRSLHLECVAGN